MSVFHQEHQLPEFAVRQLASRIDDIEQVTSPGVPASFTEPPRLITAGCIRP